MATTRLRRRVGVLEYIDSTNEILYRAAPMHYHEDFNTQNLGTVVAAGAAVASDRWVKKIVSANSSAIYVNWGTDAVENGGIFLSLAVNDEEEEAIVYHNDLLYFSGAQNAVIQMRLLFVTLPTLGGEVVWGMGSAYAKGPDAVTASAWFTADGNGLVVCETDTGATDQTVTSGITVVAGAWHVYRIEFNAGGDTWFFIDGARVASSTKFTGPGAAATLQPYFGCYKASTAGLGAILIDYIDIWTDRS